MDRLSITHRDPVRVLTRVNARPVELPADGEWPEDTWTEYRLAIGNVEWKPGTTHMDIACDWLRVDPIKIRRIEKSAIELSSGRDGSYLSIWVEP